MTERCRIEVYAYYSFMMSFIIYPVVACWVWNAEGWLAIRGFHDFAGSGVIHLLGGISGLVACIFVGPRIRKYENQVQFPFFFNKCRTEKRKAF